MSERSLASGAPTPEERERVTSELCEHFAAGHLELDALEARLTAVDEARTGAELVELTRDLPVLAAAAAPVTEPPARRGWALAVLGGASRKGRWAPPRKLHAVACMGGVELDFRDARLPPGETHVTAVAVMGGIEIVVPSGLGVTVRGLGIMGAVDQMEQEPPKNVPNAPHLRITALACMGGIEVKTRAGQSTDRLSSKPNEKRR